jgi:lipoprotein-anchoring transpeptidase ErfK/SrfK
MLKIPFPTLLLAGLMGLLLSISSVSWAQADERENMVRPAPFVLADQSRITALPPLPTTRPSLPLNTLSNIEASPPQISSPQASSQSSTNNDTQILANPSSGVRGRMASPDPETSPAVQQARLNGEKWIRVSLSEQKTYAYQGDQLVNEFIVSTGLPGTPTVTGEFRMWVRTPVQTMSGGSREAGTYYSLPNVQWVQYFYGDYGFHGAYWHNNFGNPMSRGCVNMTNEDAKWLYDWAFPEWDGRRDWYRPNQENATLVIVHP